ncbi:uncharacterized protein LOC125757449 [Rhipicephalus sanguineus]|uniref:uncharacterized protein LOC125756592 n=1 Tax=Rhipicephalus sanguineus TaxID=34632 RepID=UPI0020C518F9|nr:uncharacterized protein LOC125756592 [Rhipicephalus sanguineus]XP_049269007.1 uncharacterized protein LOC125757449 [Rhipicephalus sanguineus]
MPVSGIGEYRLGTSASWDEYVERLEMYCEANKLSKDEEKRAVLLSSCGEETYSLIVTLVKPERPTAAAYEKIKKAVREHMHPKPSVLYGRFLFYKRNQAQGESVADYVTALRRLAENCGFGDDTLPMDEMMRDRFVFGISNEAVQQRLLAERNLTFTVAYDMAVTAEATQRQQREIRTQSLSDANCTGDAAVHETRPKEPAASRDGVCYRCNGDSVYARCFAAGPRWKLAEVIKVKGPVSYLVRMANGDVHHRHRNQLRRAWPTEKPSEPLPDYHFRLPPVQSPVDVEPGITSPSPLYTPEGPELRRSTRTRRPVVRFGSSV